MTQDTRPDDTLTEDTGPGRLRLSRRDDSATVVPTVLRDGAAWSWRVLLVGLAVYVLVQLLMQVGLLVLALLGALFFTALLQPVVHLLGRLHLPRLLAVFGAVLFLVLVLLGAGVLAEQRGATVVPALVDQASSLVRQLGDVVRNTPLTDVVQVDKLQGEALSYLSDHRTDLLLDFLAGARLLVEVATATVLGLFFLLYFLYEGSGIWGWLVRLIPAARRQRVDYAGRRSWQRVGGFVRGTFLIAIFHGLFIGTALWLLDVPLFLPLAVLVFLGSFIPLIGALLFGGLAVIVTLLSQGIVPGLIFLAVLITDSQIEAHILQPFLVGRYVRLHPVAVALAISAGGLLAGVAGAIFAVPLLSAIDAVVRTLHDPPTAVAVQADDS